MYGTQKDPNVLGQWIRVSKINSLVYHKDSFVFCIFEKCLDSNPGSFRSKQARYQLSHPSRCLATHLPT